MVSATIMILDMRPRVGPRSRNHFAGALSGWNRSQNHANVLLASRLTNVARAYLQHHG
jgi:hypothetical protein